MKKPLPVFSRRLRRFPQKNSRKAASSFAKASAAKERKTAEYTKATNEASSVLETGLPLFRRCFFSCPLLCPRSVAKAMAQETGALAQEGSLPPAFCLF